MRVGRFLVQGVDVWLNNPRRPLEASGTSGMKAAQNGVPNLSASSTAGGTRAMPSDNGWAIGGRETNPDEERPGLGRRPGPVSAARGGPRPALLRPQAPACPLRWIEVMRRSMATTLWRFSTTRMLQEYVEQLYLPAAGVEVVSTGPSPGRDRGRLTDRGAADLAGPHAPQPPAGRELRLGLRGGLRARVRADARRPRAASRASACRCTTPGPSSTGSSPSAPRRSSACAPWPSAARSRSSAAASTSPCWRRCRSATGSASSRAWATSSSAGSGVGPRGAWLAERVWEPDLPTSLVAGRLRVDDPRRRPLPRRGDPRGGPLGPVHDRGPGAAPARSSGRSRGCATGSRSATSTRSSATCATTPADAGDRVGMMGDDGEKFGAWPSTWEHCWGDGRWVERFFEALEANARLADDDDPVGVARWPSTRSVASTSRPARTPRWASGRCPRRRASPSPSILHRAQAADRPEARWLRGAFWRNFQVKYREINDLHKQMLRTSDAVDRDARWPGPRAGPRPPLPGPVQRLLLARPVRRHLHQPHAARDLRAPDRGRGPRRDRDGSLRGAELRDLDIDGIDEVRLADARPGRDGRPGRGRRHRRLGHPAGPPRPDRGHAPAARRRTTSCCVATRPRWPPVCGVATVSDDGDDGDAPASIHDVIRTTEPGLDRYLAVRPVRAPLRTRPVPPGRHDAGGLGTGRGRRSSATRSRAATPSTRSVPGTSSRDARRRSGAVDGRGHQDDHARRRPPVADRSSSTSSCGTSTAHRSTRACGIEWTLTMLGGGGNPSAWWEVDGARQGHDTAGDRDRPDHHRPGQRLHRRGDPSRPWIPRPTRGGRPSRPCRTPRTASSACTRAAACCSRGRSVSAPGESIRRSVRHAVTTAHDRTAEGA